LHGGAPPYTKNTHLTDTTVDPQCYSLLLLLLDAGVGVGDLNVELEGALEDGDPLAGRHVVGDLSGHGAVVHQEGGEVRGVVHQEGLEAIGAEELGLLVRSVTNRGLTNGAAEATTDAVINTLGLPPGLLLGNRTMGEHHCKEDKIK